MCCHPGSREAIQKPALLSPQRNSAGQVACHTPGVLAGRRSEERRGARGGMCRQTDTSPAGRLNPLALAEKKKAAALTTKV